MNGKLFQNKIFMTVAPLNLIAALVLVSLGILLWGYNKNPQRAE